MKLHARSYACAMCLALSGAALGGDPATAPTLPHGIAAGDVTATTAVIWTRSTALGLVTFEWSTDATFTSVTGSATATVSDPAIPVKAAAAGLAPGTRYFTRVTDSAGNSVTGAFVTAHAGDARYGLRVGAAGDWQQAPPFPALRNVASRDLDVLLKLGDTIYADTQTPALPGVLQARTLAQFRTKHAEIGSERPEAPGFNFMPELTRSVALLNTIDDHEIVDNFAGGAAPGDSPDAPDVHPTEPPLFTDPVAYVNQTQAYIDAMRAYVDYHPSADTTWSTPTDPRVDGRPKLYRSQRYGRDAQIILLDSRSFRDAPLAPANLANPVPFILATFDPTRTLLGRPQVEQLKADLSAAQAAGVTWKFVVIPEPIQNFGVVNAEDRFEGFAAERNEILRHIDQQEITNVVFLAGDFHGTIVNNLTYQDAPFGPQKATNAIEIVTGPASFFTGRFGPSVANIAAAAGLISPAEFAFYQSLPINPDPDSVPNDKDDFIKSLLVAQTSPLGYDPVGLNNNLPVAAGRFNAELLAGDYVACHAYAWAEIDINAADQSVLVTIWSTPAHSEADFLANPADVVSRIPAVSSSFRLGPIFARGDVDCDGLIDMSDIDPFVAKIGCPSAGAGCDSGCGWRVADIDGDGDVDFGDIDPFVECLMSGSCAGV